MPVYIVNKPLGFTSHDVVAKTRRLLKTRAVGHAGTLDPLATGVLVILTEEATKLSPFLTESDKHYLVWVTFGVNTPTLDAEGPVSATADASHLTEEMIQNALPKFLELTEQLPPQYSAIKQQGVKSYEAARKGEALKLPPRPAGYHTIELLEFQPSRNNLSTTFGLTPEGTWSAKDKGITFTLPPLLQDNPTALFYVTVRAGTYIRAFARDLGEALNVPAHLSGLVRTRAGRSGLEQAVGLEDIPNTSGINMIDALPYPLVQLGDSEAQRIRQGQRLSPTFTGRVGLLNNKQLVAVVENDNGKMNLLRVWQI
ncbi:MAG: tRNA pseudouridine(55) synthase TruB [Trueperaceae bacterium]